MGETEPSVLLPNGRNSNIHPPATSEPHQAHGAHSPTCGVQTHAMQMRTCTSGATLSFVVAYFPTANLASQTEKARQNKTNERNKTQPKHKNNKLRVKGGIEPLGFTSSPTDLKSALQNHWRSFTLNDTEVTMGGPYLRLCDHEQSESTPKVSSRPWFWTRQQHAPQ